MSEKKYEFRVVDNGGSRYNVSKDSLGTSYQLYYDDGVYSGISYPVNCDGTNWINYVERIPYKQKKEKLNLPIVYRHSIWPEELRVLVRGSKGMVSVFEEGSFSADEWTDKQVKKSIKSGMWIVQTSGNVSCSSESNCCDCDELMTEKE